MISFLIISGFLFHKYWILSTKITDLETKIELLHQKISDLQTINIDQDYQIIP